MVSHLFMIICHYSIPCTSIEIPPGELVIVNIGWAIQLSSAALGVIIPNHSHHITLQVTYHLSGLDVLVKMILGSFLSGQVS